MTDWTRVHAYAKHTSIEQYPITSFLLSAVSFHQEVIKDLEVNESLQMDFEVNKYDPTAIVIKRGLEICGYVPKDIKEKVLSFVPSKVKVIEKRLYKGIYSLRVDIV